MQTDEPVVPSYGLARTATLTVCRGTQNIEAMMPSAVGPTTSGGPHDGASLASSPSTHCSEAPNGKGGGMSTHREGRRHPKEGGVGG